MSVTVPEARRDLLESPICATMVTLLPDGMPHASVVWFKYEDDHLWVSIGAGSQKHRNLQQDGRVAFTIIDPQNPYRYLEVRGELAELLPEGGQELLDELSLRYTGQKYYGGFAPEEARRNPMVIARIRPTRLRANA